MKKIWHSNGDLLLKKIDTYCSTFSNNISMMGESTIFNQSEVSQQTTQRILTVKTCDCHYCESKYPPVATIRSK